MSTRRAMGVRHKLKLLMLASMSFLLAVAVSAGVVSDATDGNTLRAVSPLAKGPTTCVDLNDDCSTLMINYYGDSVEFALLRRGGLKDETDRAYSTDSDQPDKPADPENELSISEKMKSDNASQQLGIDFLRGFKDKGIDPAFKDEISAKRDGAAGVVGMHGWAFAAATSMDYSFQQSNPDGIAAPGHSGEDSLTFWDFEHVYLWEVEENVLDSGRCDISQVALSDIYLSPKTNSTSDPKIVVCELNDDNNCRPLSD